MLKFLDHFAVWISPLWILLGSALGLHGLWKTMSKGAVGLYILAAVALALLSARSGLQQQAIQVRQAKEQARLEDAHTRFERQQLAQQQGFSDQQKALAAEQQAFSRQQTNMADDLKRLADLERNSNALAGVTARVVNVDDPGVQLMNNSSVEGRDISWEAVLWNLEISTMQPLQIPSQTANFIKPKTMFLPYSLFANRGIQPHEGDRLFGYLSLDCANCQGSQNYWVFVNYAQSGWIAPVPPALPINLDFLTKHLDAFRKDRTGRWLEDIAPLGIRLPIQSTKNPTIQ